MSSCVAAIYVIILSTQLATNKWSLATDEYDKI